MWFARSGVMGLATMTLEMRTPEEHRERLHELVKATRTAVVVSGTPGDEIDGKPMTMARTGDDTTMYLASSFDAAQVSALERGPRVTVVLQGAGYAVFSGEARISRDRRLIDELWADSWRLWSRGKWDPSLAIVIVSPIEGSYWEGTDRHSYLYRLVDR
jgi:general stress protein 26